MRMSIISTLLVLGQSVLPCADIDALRGFEVLAAIPCPAVTITWDASGSSVLVGGEFGIRRYQIGSIEPIANAKLDGSVFKIATTRGLIAAATRKKLYLLSTEDLKTLATVDIMFVHAMVGFSGNPAFIVLAGEPLTTKFPNEICMVDALGKIRWRSTFADLESKFGQGLGVGSSPAKLVDGGVMILGSDDKILVLGSARGGISSEQAGICVLKVGDKGVRWERNVPRIDLMGPGPLPDTIITKCAPVITASAAITAVEPFINISSLADPEKPAIVIPKIFAAGTQYTIDQRMHMIIEFEHRRTWLLDSLGVARKVLWESAIEMIPSPIGGMLIFREERHFTILKVLPW